MSAWQCSWMEKAQVPANIYENMVKISCRLRWELACTQQVFGSEGINRLIIVFRCTAHDATNVINTGKLIQATNSKVIRVLRIGDNGIKAHNIAAMLAAMRTEAMAHKHVGSLLCSQIKLEQKQQKDRERKRKKMRRESTKGQKQ